MTFDDPIFYYPVPKLSPDGSCSLGYAMEEKPYDLSLIFGRTKEAALYLKRLRQRVIDAQKIVGADWFGIYKKVKKVGTVGGSAAGQTYLSGEEVLVKVAYKGAPSRAEFPLTKEFAAHSNNSTVGLTGKAILVRDVAEYNGPYYKCDGRVRSEFCCPIPNSADEVVGIIDAESFHPDFFTPEKQQYVEKLAEDLWKIL